MQALKVASPSSSAMHLPTVDRGILAENRQLLERRWELIRSGEIDEIKQVDRWFPGQRHLFQVLSVTTYDQMEQMADCGIPLFSLRLPTGANDALFQATTKNTAFEADCIDEVFIALLDRLDALRTGYTQALTMYDLSPSQANYISRFGPRELKSVASDPAVVLLPSVADDFFTHAAMTPMSSRERSVLAGTTRRSRSF